MERAIHWDYADTFSGKEAAYLMGGFDPSEQRLETEYKIRPIVTRMKKSYYAAVGALVFGIRQGAGFFADREETIFAQVNPLKRRKATAGELWSFEIEKLIDDYNFQYRAAAIPEEFEFCIQDKDSLSIEDIKRRIRANLDAYDTQESDRLKDLEQTVPAGLSLFNWSCEDVHEFDDQKFSREELGRWTRENGLETNYKFSRNTPEVGAGEKALGANERNTLLVIIAALCKRANIDADNHKAASELVRAIESIGLTLTNDTTRKVLAQVGNAVATRKK